MMELQLPEIIATVTSAGIISFVGMLWRDVRTANKDVNDLNVRLSVLESQYATILEKLDRMELKLFS